MQTEPNEQLDILLVKHMLGEASPAEQQEVQDWLAQDSVNYRHYQQLHAIWLQSKNIAAAGAINEEDAWRRYQQKKASGGFTGNTSVRTLAAGRFRHRLFAAAAALVLLAAGSLFLLLKGRSGRAIEITAGRDVVTDTLPDGSVVTLNANARLRYEKNWENQVQRQLKLEGEAFFEVAPDRNKPFVIIAGEVNILVTGTSFNVKRYKDATEIIVATGSVKITHNGKAIQLRQEEKITVKPDARQLVKQSSNDELYAYYRTRQFVCRNTPLHQLVNVLNEAYQADIIIANENIKNLPITTTFHQQSLDSITVVIGKTLGLQVLKQNHQIVLK